MQQPYPSLTDATVLDWVVLKVVQRCNLNCDYCYVYNRGDDSWKSRAPVVSQLVIETLADRIREHCATHDLKRFVVELHGGEPLLLGKARMQRLIDTLRARAKPVDLRFLLQTNGLLLDSEWLALFDKNDVSFGMSLDGPPEVNDRHRVFANGSASTRRLLEVVRGLRAEGPLFDRLLGGVLAVIDPAANGGDLVRWFASEGFRSFEFLLPDGTYRNYPPGWTGAAPYRRFLIEAFGAWYSMGRDAPRIRLFEMMMLGLMGQPTTLDALGGDIRKLCVIESDGSIGISDVVRICGRDYAYDRLNIFEHGLDVHAAYHSLDRIQRACDQCQACPAFKACGGGYLPHRHDGVSFDNPSIYCEALYGLSRRMLEELQAGLPASAIRYARFTAPNIPSKIDNVA